MSHISFSLVRNRFFWMTNVFVWLSFLAIVTHIQWTTDGHQRTLNNWLNQWYLISPWFLNWIWLTAAVFVVNGRITGLQLSHLRAGALHFVAMLGLLTVYWFVAIFFHLLLRRPEELSTTFFSEWLRIIGSSAQLDVLMYVGVLGVAKGVAAYHSLIQDRISLRNIQAELTHEQLKTLRSQLNPHFLFNALNTIASLVRLKREKEAVTALSELSMMLRKVLETKNNDEVKIREEIAFISNYLAIQKLRFSNKLLTEIHVDEDCLDISIPNMLIHPMVENAVQHGSQLESNANPLKLDICLRQDNLMITLTNRVAENDKHQGFGIGMSNTRERLQRMFEHYRLEMQPLNDSVFQTILVIPLGELNA